MAGSCTEEAGVGRSLDCVSNGQQECQSLAEWRSSEQVENGTPSTSPPYWDSDDDDCGPKPSELYGKYTWKIDKFSQINKRELRSNAFEVGSYKWYILVYPQGCDVCNHLSLFLCVANHDKLLPGWSHFAQFTIAVVNKDPKKSKYSDTLHRFWKKEHDWGWKKFMELSKVLDGFIDSDTLIIKAQVQVIRERVDRPFSCLDCQYRRELVRVYLTNVEQICRRFVEERRGKLGKLIEDKARWTSFCAFWSGMNPAVKFLMTREKTESILRVVVKHFFIEKEVTSTLVMGSLFSGLKALEGQTKSKNDKRKLNLAEEVLAPVVCMEKDMFVLVDDVLLLLERVATEPLPPKDDKGPQNRTKDGSPGEDFNKESIERDERRLTELGRRTIETFVLSHIFSSKIEVAYQDAVSLKRQEELIREEEAEWMVASEQKSKRGTAEKKSKKKQGKQKRNNRKIKDKGKSEKSSWPVQDNIEPESPISEREEYFTEEAVAVTAKSGALDDASDLSDSLDCVTEILHPESEERDASPVSCGTDTSEMNPFIESSNGLMCRTPPVMDDSSSTCSTDSVPSVVTNGHNKGDIKAQTSQNRGRKQQGNMRPVSAWKQVPENTDPDSNRLKQDTESAQPMNSSEASMPLKPLEKLSAPLRPAKTDKASQDSDTTQKPETPQLPVVPKPPTPLAPGPRPTAPIVSMVHSTPLLARSVSAAGRLGPEPSSTSQSYIPQSYRNAIMGSRGAGISYVQAKSPAQAPAVSPECSERTGLNSVRPGFSFGRQNQDLFGKWTDNYPSNSSSSIPSDHPSNSGRILSSDLPSVLSEIRNFDVYNPIHLRSPNNPPSEPSPCTSGPQSNTAMADEFPHLDIINDLLDDDLGIEIGTSTSSSFESFGNRPQHLTRQFSFPGDIGMLNDICPPMNSCRFERTQSYQEDGYRHDYIFPGSPWESFREMLHHSNSGPGSHPDQWHMASSNDQSFVDARDLENASYAYHIPDYSNLACGINGYDGFRPSSGF